jgi:uncharacterized protein YciI
MKSIGTRENASPTIERFERRKRSNDPNDYSLAIMFVIELTYKAPLKDIDASMPAHMRFLKKYYAAGKFLVSGRKIPRDGGIILAVGGSREQMEAIAKEDPFYVRGLADVRVIEFRASQRADAIQKLIEP